MFATSSCALSSRFLCHLRILRVEVASHAHRCDFEVFSLSSNCEHELVPMYAQEKGRVASGSLSPAPAPRMLSTLLSLVE